MDQPKTDQQSIVENEESSSNTKDLIKLIGLMGISVLAAWLAMKVWDFIS